MYRLIYKCIEYFVLVQFGICFNKLQNKLFENNEN